MKKTATVVYIILVIIPLFIFFSPFTWGMRKKPFYNPSEKTVNLMEKLDRRYRVSSFVRTAEDSVWYFRDIRTKKILKLENFYMGVTLDSLHKFNSQNIKNYGDDFSKEFEHKSYYDSLIIVNDSDSILYKVKMK